MRRLFVAVAVLFLSACASQEPALVSSSAPLIVANDTTQLTPDTKLVCRKESSLGSQMIHTVCEAPQSDADRNATQRALRSMSPPNSVPRSAIGN